MLAPARSEETEAQRSSKARMVRSTRRSTQGIASDVLEEARRLSSTAVPSAISTTVIPSTTTTTTTISAAAIVTPTPVQVRFISTPIINSYRYSSTRGRFVACHSSSHSHASRDHGR